MRLAIGDIHGRPFWTQYLSEDYSAYYILGDYFDSFDIPFTMQMQNFQKIVAFAHKDKRLKLCLGNHDYHYLADNMREHYSGFQSIHAVDIQESLKSNLDLFNIVYITDDDILISHAGISRSFIDLHGLSVLEEINARFRENSNFLAFNGVDIYGNDKTQGPLWIRPDALCSDFLSGYSQIVGHTPVSVISTRTIQDTLTGKSLTLTLIDTHNTESILRF